MALSDFLNVETLNTPPAEQQTPLRGTGGGLADAIPATIEGEQPAALAEGEFVWPADVVSMVGDGSSEAGARVLNRLVEKIREAKQGGKEQSAGLSEILGA